MSEAIGDTGPIRHLYEIAHLESLRVFDHITISDLVAGELTTAQIDIEDLRTGELLKVTTVPADAFQRVLSDHKAASIQSADAQVFVLAQESRFQIPVLTDDLALRRLLENYKATVVGSVGILVRSYSSGLLSRDDLLKAIEQLFTQSTLHSSRAFRAYIYNLLTKLP